MNRPRLVSAIYSRGPSLADREQRQRNLERFERELWRCHGIVLVRPEEVIGDDWFRQAAINHATRRYGPRPK